uniref:Uncharacterized protein n=1 Tax=Anguilla anguilla TaxID=7936 RepID=A0A0E9WEZ4_ANGAN
MLPLCHYIYVCVCLFFMYNILFQAYRLLLNQLKVQYIIIVPNNQDSDTMIIDHTVKCGSIVTGTFFVFWLCTPAHWI